MNPEELLAAITALVDGLRGDMTKLSERCDALDASVKKKADDEGEMAERVAADSAANLRSDMRVMQSQLNQLVIKQPRGRTQADNDAFADAQAKADAVLRAHNEQASPPMAGEELADYLIRLHRPMQKHSTRFAKAQLATIAGDSTVFENVLAQIRADAYEAGIRPVGLPLFAHREIKTESPGGHRISTFHGNGTIFAQLSSPTRRILSIGADPRRPNSSGGSVYQPLQ